MKTINVSKADSLVIKQAVLICAYGMATDEQLREEIEALETCEPTMLATEAIDYLRLTIVANSTNNLQDQVAVGCRQALVAELMMRTNEI